MALLDKNRILNGDDQQWEDIHIPEWDDRAEDGKAIVRIRGLSGEEVDRYERSLMTMRKGKPEMVMENATARLVAWCLVDENNSRLFVTDDEVKELGKRSARALARCFDKAAQLSGLRQSDIEAMVGDFS